MSYRISKDFTFSASHQLAHLPDGHPCTRLHGHNYVVRVTLTGDVLDDADMLLDYGQLAPVAEYLDTAMDHQHLNDLGFQPTAEALAKHLWFMVMDRVNVPEGVAVEVAVSETAKTWASYRP